MVVKNTSSKQPHRWSRLSIQTLIPTKLVSNFPASYATQMLITVLTDASHWILSSQLNPVQNSHTPHSLKINFNVSSRLILDHPTVLFASTPFNKLGYFSYSHRSTCPVHLILHNLI
jgi:hypothetical protein